MLYVVCVLAMCCFLVACEPPARRTPRSSKKPLEGKEKEAALLYGAVLKHSPPPIQMSLPQVLRSKIFTDMESNNPGIQKQVQQGAAGCTGICEKAIQAVIDAAAAVAQITKHTGGPTNIPNAIVTKMQTHPQSLHCLTVAPPPTAIAKEQRQDKEALKEKRIYI